MDGWMDDGWMDGWMMDGWMDGWIVVFQVTRNNLRGGRTTVGSLGLRMPKLSMCVLRII